MDKKSLSERDICMLPFGEVSQAEIASDISKQAKAGAKTKRAKTTPVDLAAEREARAERVEREREFFDAYPSGADVAVGSDKAAVSYWRMLSPAGRDSALDALDSYVALCRKKKQIIASAAGYLAYAYWQNAAIERRSQRPASRSSLVTGHGASKQPCSPTRSGRAPDYDGRGPAIPPARRSASLLRPWRRLFRIMFSRRSSPKRFVAGSRARRASRG
jgi:hypothetical protein